MDEVRKLRENARTCQREGAGTHRNAGDAGRVAALWIEARNAERPALTPAPAPDARADWTPPSETQVNSACLSFDHSFGLMSGEDQKRMRFHAREWLHAWRKEMRLPLPPAPAQEDAK